MSIFSRFSSFSPKEARNYIAATILIFLLFSFGIFANTRTFFQSQLYATGNGIQKGLEFVLFKKGTMQTRIQELESEVTELHTLRAQQDLLLQENTELRSAIATIAVQPSIFATAQTAYVITKSTSSSQHILRINSGTKDGVEKDDIVTSPEGYLIGIIDAASEHMATVRLLQDSRSSIPVKVLSTRNTEGLIEGKSGFHLNLSFVPIDTDLQTDLLVVTTGIEGRYPAGLPIGKVSEITEPENAAFKQVLVEPLVDARDLISVLVL